MPTRRAFLSASAVAAVGPHVHAAGSDVIRVGLVGCGGRGTGAAGNALAADPHVKLVAMADAFDDRLQTSLDTLLKKPAVAARVDVPPDRRFVGFDAYKDVIAASDVVLLCTPPHFRPAHLRAAVDAGKHVFAEKPVAVDGPGVRAVLAACADAKKKNLSVVSGLCLRYHAGFREAVARVRDGAIGEVRVVHAADLRTGRWAKPRQPGQSDMQYQMRNWYNFAWLSGDFNVEQHVHYLDVAAWLMGDRYPTKAVGVGGRQVLTGAEYGNVFDHFAVSYEYPDGGRIESFCRQQPGTATDSSAAVIGTAGTALFTEGSRGIGVKGATPWMYAPPAAEADMYQVEHEALFAAVRSGTPVNNGDYMARSTLLAIMGRTAAYTGKAVTWDAALNAAEDLSPAAYTWAAAPPAAGVPIPGVTRVR